MASTGKFGVAAYLSLFKMANGMRDKIQRIEAEDKWWKEKERNWKRIGANNKST